jgi:hypothetical protein
MGAEVMEEVLRRRTPEEIEAYVQGYNACYERFCECLKNRKSVPNAVMKMRVFVDTVNGIVTRHKADLD